MKDLKRKESGWKEIKKKGEEHREMKLTDIFDDTIRYNEFFVTTKGEFFEQLERFDTMNFLSQGKVSFLNNWNLIGVVK
jgi:hypothetical protein